MKANIFVMAAVAGMLCSPLLADEAKSDDAQAPRRHPGKAQAVGPGEAVMRQLSIDNPAKFEELKKLKESNPDAFKEEMGKLVSEYREKLKAQHERARALMEEYKKNPTEENKAKLRAELEKNFNERMKGREQQLQDASKKLEESKAQFEKTKQDRDAKIDDILAKFLERKDAKGDGTQQPPAAPVPQQ